jgi:D-aminoacyl-tRNA deacylase
VRALVQRVSSASVTIENEVVGEIGEGLVVLLGVGVGDGSPQAKKLADKVSRLRVFEGTEDGRTRPMHRSLLDLGASVLCISQFTLYGDTRRGLRPSFTEAAEPELAERLYDEFCDGLEQRGVHVERGRFGARMSVALVNEGPVTLSIEA